MLDSVVFLIVSNQESAVLKLGIKELSQFCDGAKGS